MNTKPGDKVTLTPNWSGKEDTRVHLVKKVYKEQDEIVIICSCDTIPNFYFKKVDNEQAITCSRCLDYLSEA